MCSDVLLFTITLIRTVNVLMCIMTHKKENIAYGFLKSLIKDPFPFYLFIYLTEEKVLGRKHFGGWCSGPGYLNHIRIDLWGQTVLCCEGCSVHCKMFVSILGATYQMPVASLLPTPQLWQSECLQTLPNVAQGPKSS